jgi:hypothetical protein
MVRFLLPVVVWWRTKVSLVLEAIVDVAGVEVGLVSAAGGKRGGVFEGAWTCPLFFFTIR